MFEPTRRRSGPPAVALAVLGLLAVTVVSLLLSPRPAVDRVQELSLSLRCPVCKSVSIAESPSETAVAMRQVVAEQVAVGRSDPEIIGFFRARYGDWVLLDPPVRDTTLALWLVPAAVAVLGVVLVLTRVRRRPDGLAVELDAPRRARVVAAVMRARATVPDGRDEP